MELFTSEGCSSCPPADKLLSSLSAHQPIDGVEIIPLSEHVDYWNRLGWTDPFSSAAFSERQREYAEALKSDAYTPQMVVDGKATFVGSDESRAFAAISGELNAPRAMVSIQPVGPANSSGQSSTSFSVNVGELSRLSLTGNASVVLVVTEDNLQSAVRSGENSGRNLVHTGVVRELKTIATIDLERKAVFRAQSEVKISSAWKRKDLRAIVFVQHQGSHRIIGVAETNFPAP